MTKSVLSAKSEALVDKVIALLSVPENAEFYNQETYVKIHYVYDDRMKKTSCGTECCIAGWLVYAKSRELYDKIVQNYLNNLGFEAGNLLTLKDGSFADTSDLFRGGATAWVYPFGSSFEKAKGNKTKEVKVAIARLKYFKRTGQ